MKEKNKLVGIIIPILILVAVIHSMLQLTIFGTGISSFNEAGISGFSIGKLKVGEGFKNNGSISLVSKIIIALEWALLISSIIFVLIKNKREMKEEIENTKLPKIKISKSEKTTELDTLYNLIKEKKHLRLSTIAKIFKVKKEIALNWARTLESGNLVKISYPKFGEPEVFLNE